MAPGKIKLAPVEIEWFKHLSKNDREQYDLLLRYLRYHCQAMDPKNGEANLDKFLGVNKLETLFGQNSNGSGWIFNDKAIKDKDKDTSVNLFGGSDLVKKQENYDSFVKSLKDFGKAATSGYEELTKFVCKEFQATNDRLDIATRDKATYEKLALEYGFFSDNNAPHTKWETVKSVFSSLFVPPVPLHLREELDGDAIEGLEEGRAREILDGRRKARAKAISMDENIGYARIGFIVAAGGIGATVFILSFIGAAAIAALPITGGVLAGIAAVLLVGNWVRNYVNNRESNESGKPEGKSIEKVQNLAKQKTQELEGPSGTPIDSKLFSMDIKEIERLFRDAKKNDEYQKEILAILERYKKPALNPNNMKGISKQSQQHVDLTNLKQGDQNGKHSGAFPPNIQDFHKNQKNKTQERQEPFDNEVEKAVNYKI